MYAILGVLVVISGMIFLWCIVFENAPSYWSRRALYLQIIVLFFATLLLPLRPPTRLYIYPLILITAIYVWDITLPPPTLPGGTLRAIVPRLVLLGSLVDFFSLLRRHQILR
jgi:hypothetical protein